MMHSPGNDIVESTSTDDVVGNGDASDSKEDSNLPTSSTVETVHPPAKRRLSSAAVIEISDTDSDDSDICAVTTYTASADEVKRIRGDRDYSSSSSSSTSSSGSYSSESECEDDSPVIHLLCHPLPPKQPSTAVSRTDDPTINPNFNKPETIELISKHWSECSELESPDIDLVTSPFRLCLLHHFLANPDYIYNMVDDMNTLDWARKKMDLFEFHQTSDLAGHTWQRSIRGIYQLLKTELMPWVSKVTSLELNEMSLSCSLYGPGDHLLPHDDLLGDRRVAFILYLLPWTLDRTLHNGQHKNHSQESIKTYHGRNSSWGPEMGGALQLYEAEGGRPSKVAAQLYPSNNMLAFFPVSRDSFHQVSEVTSLEMPRLSINGWFHGPSSPLSPAEPDPVPQPVKPHGDTVVLQEWLNVTYMSPRTRVHAQSEMEARSEISLPDFLLPTKYQQLLEALQDPDVEWELAGPAHQRKYMQVSVSWLERQEDGHPLKGLHQLVGSSAWLRLLADLTDLPSARLLPPAIQMWRPTDYTLLPPSSQYQEPRLDILLHLGVSGSPPGARLYLAPSEPDSTVLVSVPPTDNALALVYCDSGAASFTKYLNKINTKPKDKYYCLACSYLE